MPSYQVCQKHDQNVGVCKEQLQYGCILHRKVVVLDQGDTLHIRGEQVSLNEIVADNKKIQKLVNFPIEDLNDNGWMNYTIFPNDNPNQLELFDTIDFQTKDRFGRDITDYARMIYKGQAR